MYRDKLNLRSVVAIAICLAVTTFISNCNKVQAQTIKNFPYINFFKADADLSGWTLINSVFNKSIGARLELKPQFSEERILEEPCYIETPTLNLTELENPTLIFELRLAEGCSVYASTNGEDYFPILKCTKDANSISLSKDVKYVRFLVIEDINTTLTGNWGRTLMYIQIFDKKIISSFPYTENFETENSVAGWILQNLYPRIFSLGDRIGLSGETGFGETPFDMYSISPELNLNSLTEPILEINAADVVVKTSIDGENYTTINLNRDDPYHSPSHYQGNLSSQDKYIWIGTNNGNGFDVGYIKINDGSLTSILRESIEKICPIFNSTTGIINIYPKSLNVEKLRLFDQNGKLIKEEHNTSAMDIGIFPAAVYFLQITLDDKTIVEKIVKL